MARSRTAPRQPRRPGVVSITGRRKTRRSDVIQKEDKDDAVLETYERSVERRGPHSVDDEGPDVFPPAPTRLPPD